MKFMTRSLLGKAAQSRAHELRSPTLFLLIQENSSLATIDGKGGTQCDAIKKIKDLREAARMQKNAASRYLYKVDGMGDAATPEMQKAARNQLKYARSSEYYVNKELKKLLIQFWEYSW
jgi:hypothetical protein